jgi:hypothetical protein
MIKTAAAVFEAHGWTSQRLERLNRDELTNLRDNAERLGEPALALVCAHLLTKRPGRRASKVATVTPLQVRRRFR